MLFYYFNIDITAQVKNLFTKDEPRTDIAINQDTKDKPEPAPEPKPKPEPEPEPSRGSKEVFNISDVYTYDDVPVCKAYDAELATYDQLKIHIERW